MKRLFAAVGALAVLIGWAAAAHAQSLTVPIDKARMIRLDKDASIVLIANPNIADVAIENPRLLFLIGREPGETNMIILDERGAEILAQPVVVIPTLDRHVSLYRATREATMSCDPRCTGVPNPGKGAAAPSGGGQGDQQQNEKGQAAPAPTAADIAAAAAAAAAQAVKPQEGTQSK